MQTTRLARLTRAASLAYLVGLILVIALLRFFGERFWLAAVALYLPRFLFALPLLLLVPALLLLGPRQLLWTQAVAALLCLFPLMGLVLGHPRSATVPGKTLRIASYNIWFARRGRQAIREEVAALRPDILLFQATRYERDPFFTQLFQGQHLNIHESNELLIATRFPIREVYVPPDLPDATRHAQPVPANFVRYTLETELGPIDVINVHPFSPRDGFEGVRGQGLRVTMLRHGWIPVESVRQMDENIAVRRRQVEAAVREARRARHPVIIAGDTNLPGLSQIYAENLGAYQDGFAEVGTGFGYTFPAQLRLPPWMRIDRILAGPGLRFLNFTVGGRRGSDHCPVAAELELEVQPQAH